MNAGYRSLLWYLLAGTRGGPSRIRILELLRISPHNPNQLALALGVDYRTIRHHLRILEQNGLVRRPVGNKYAAPYELAPELSAHYEMVSEIQGAPTSKPGRRSSRLENPFKGSAI